MRYPCILGLTSVNHITKNPTAGFTVRVSCGFAIEAFAALGNAGYGTAIADLYIADRRSNRNNFPAKLMTENPGGFHFRHAAMPNVNIGSTNCGSSDTNNSIIWFNNLWYRHFIERYFLRTMINQCFHSVFHFATYLSLLLIDLFIYYDFPILGYITINCIA